jgi:hypothetical protein
MENAVFVNGRVAAFLTTEDIDPSSFHPQIGVARWQNFALVKEIIGVKVVIDEARLVEDAVTELGPLVDQEFGCWVTSR